MKNIIESLKSSPIFNLSLTSKELFHSNFIAWLISEYPNDMWSVFSKYTEVKDSVKFEIVKDTVEREEKHIDLMFQIKRNDEIDNSENWERVIIENKVKSLPYLKQLKEYFDNFPKAHCILLSLSIPNHLLNEDKKKVSESNWFLLTYEEFSVKLEMQLQIGFKGCSNDNIYHRMIISDYIKFIKNLVEINRNTEVLESDYYDWYGDVFKELDNIRLGDFYVKKKCENISHLIFDKIKKIGLGNVNKMSISSSIVNSTNGEFRFYYEINRRITISIEVSRMYYRKMVHLKNQIKEKNEIRKFRPYYEADSVAKFFDKELKWFDFSNILKQDKTYSPRNDFNKFWDTRYRQCLLNDENTINEIIQYFIEDFISIIAKEDIINKTFK